jgi:hypothetical protein
VAKTPASSSRNFSDLILSGKARPGLRVEGKLDLSGKKQLRKLPAGLACYELDASGTSLTTLPDDLQVECSLTLTDCRELSSLPRNLKVGTLNVANCTDLTELPEGLDVWFLNVSGCTRLTHFPQQARIEHGAIIASGCMALCELPDYLTDLGTLDVGNCPQLTSLPPKLQVSSWIEVAGSGIKDLPSRLKDVGVRWRGVMVDHTTAFFPERLQAKIVLKERNAERRRVMIERMGFDRFMREARAERLDADRDPGGPRELLRVAMRGDEDIVSLSVRCPSTGRHYLLRVPPTMKTCHQAAAWMAGFDDPKRYKPVKET